MMLTCNVCSQELKSPIYQSPDNSAITTMNKLIEGQTQIYFCLHCGHLQTNELPNLTAYYAQEYAINLSSESEDQLYKVVEGQAIYRAEHQANTLLAKVNFFPGCRVLDYGCAKAPTLKKILTVQPEIEPFVFDVTDKYIPFWKRFPKQPQWSTHELDPSWQQSMDVVLSFYALEHISDLQTTVKHMKSLLKPNGIFYFIVPNVYENIADFIVADHINHFSKSSLEQLLQQAGFTEIEVDDQVHDAAFVVKAVYTASENPLEPTQDLHIQQAYEQALEMATYWQNIVISIKKFEQLLPSEEAMAIYGAGFYGHFIAASLKHPERIRCFVDQNQYLQGTELNGKKIVAPDSLDASINHVLVGMNPRHAKANIAAIESWQNRDLNYFFL